MMELHSWLSHQHPGLNTYRAFQQKSIELADQKVVCRALYKLLSSIVDPYIEAYDEEPLPSDVAKRSFERLLAVVHDAENSISLDPEKQMAVLNRVASVDLV